VKLRVLYSSAIFIGSYLPLALILLVQDVDYAILKNGFCKWFWKLGATCQIPLVHPRFALVILGLCLLGFCLTLIALHAISPKLPIKIIEAKYIPAELMSYTLPYVVAFMSIGYQETGKFAGLSIFLVWMFWITHKAGQILLNPLLTVFGWRLYEVKYAFAGDTTTHNGRALVRGTVESDQRFAHMAIQDILILKPMVSKNER
jgi:hypothetical protein